MIYDCTISLHENILVWPRDSKFRRDAIQSVEKDGNETSLLTIGSHCGTHIDAPKHFVADGASVDQIPLETLIGPAQMIQIPDDHSAITVAELEGITLGERVLFRTANSTRRLLSGNQFEPNFVGLTRDAAEYLVAQDVKLVGVDYLSCEVEGDRTFPVHKTLLSAGIVIIESIDLSSVPPGDYHLTALPLRIKDGDGSPCRIVLNCLEN